MVVLIRMVQSSPVREDVDEFLGAIETESAIPDTSWIVTLLLNGTALTSKLIQALM